MCFRLFNSFGYAGMNKLLVGIFAVLCANLAQAKPNDLTVHYDVHIFGLHVASIVDHLQFGEDGTYRINSIGTPTAPWSWLVDPLLRSSQGVVDANTGRMLVEEYVTSIGDHLASSTVDRSSGTVVNDYKGYVQRISLEAAGEAPHIHDSLTMPYDFYVQGGNATRILSHMLIDGKRVRSYEWRRTDTQETVVYMGQSYSAGRYDRYKNGLIRSSVWFVSDLYTLPVLASLQIGWNISIQVTLTGYHLESPAQST